MQPVILATSGPSAALCLHREYSEIESPRWKLLHEKVSWRSHIIFSLWDSCLPWWSECCSVAVASGESSPSCAPTCWCFQPGQICRPVEPKCRGMCRGSAAIPVLAWCSAGLQGLWGGTGKVKNGSCPNPFLNLHDSQGKVTCCNLTGQESQPVLFFWQKST